MDEYTKKPEPKKIRLMPLVDRSDEYDTLSFEGNTLPEPKTLYEDHRKDNPKSIPKLESEQSD